MFSRFGKYLGKNPPLTSLGREDIRGYLGFLKDQDGLSKSTLAIHYRVLRAFFNWAVKEDILKESPMEKIEKPKTPKKYPRIISDDQAKTLIMQAKSRKNWAGRRLYAIVSMFLDAGLRRNELITAKLKNLKLENRFLKVHGKSAKDRNVFFGNKTKKALRDWLKVREKISAEVRSDTIFIDQKGNQINPRNLSRL